MSDICSALTLLFLARWVHRDISEGNIILVRSKHGVRVKLSDLDYKRFFSKEDGAVSADPKTVRIFLCNTAFCLSVDESHREHLTSCPWRSIKEHSFLINVHQLNLMFL
jgi:serine/threonine protein kinase